MKMKKGKAVLLSILICVLFVPAIIGLALYVSMNVDRELNAEEAEKFYQEYLTDMNEYGMTDVEKITKEYFTSDLIEVMNIQGVKADFYQMNQLKVKFKGKVIKAEKFDDGLYIAVDEWLEIDGQSIKEDILKGVYVIVKEDGKLKFSTIAGMSEDIDDEEVLESETDENVEIIIEDEIDSEVEAESEKEKNNN